MTLANHRGGQTPQFRVLSDEQCQAIFLATIECLNRVGMHIDYPPAQELLRDAGARVEGNRIFIPAHIIQDAVASAPGSFNLWGRDGTLPLQVAPDHVFFGPGPTCTYFYDPETGQRRQARRGDAGLTARVVDGLPNIDYAMGLSLLGDVTPALAPVYEFAEMIANTRKPIAAWANDPATLEDIYRIASIAAGGSDALRRKPFVLFFSTYESPLRLAGDQLANLIWAAQHAMPVVCLGGPTMGLESPPYSASALMLHLASALSALAVVQLAQRGAAMMVGGVPSAMDMRNARPSYGSPESILNTAAASDLARYLGLPFMGTAGASESKLLDAQAGVEIALQIMASCLSGAGMVHDVGFLDCADIGSLELLVLADEVIAMLKRFMRGVEVSPETLMLDLVEEVGPGGMFLNQTKSAALCRSQIWVPTLIDRNAYAIWEKNGEQDMKQRVQTKLRHILDTHQPAPLPEGAEAEIEAILLGAEKRYQG